MVEKEKPADYLGCKHYGRACLMECPDYERCGKGKFYPCRLCHNEIHFEKELDPKKNHQLDRHAVKHVKCLRCDTEQEKGPTCISCKKDFSLYFCSVCCLYDDDFERKKVFHCEGCGICQVGGRENFFHCDKCEMCLSIHMKANHKCVEARFKQDCTVCMEDL